MAMGLTKLGAAIISVIVAASLTALLVEIMCVLRRRQRLGGRVRAEPQEAVTGASSSPVPSSWKLEVVEEQQQHATKWSRMLFTIKEGETEGLDSTTLSSTETSAVMTNKANKLNETTPFSTPCASPLSR